MKIFVTGASGFIGQRLAKRLVENGHKVSVLVRKTSNIEPLKGLKLNVFYGDLDDANVLEDACKDAEYVFHIAGVIHLVNVPDKVYWDANVTGTENVVKAALKSKSLKRFIYCSSASCYGHVDNESDTFVDEDYPCHSQNIYGKTKYEGEKIIEKYAKENSREYIIIRPSRVYGPGDLTLLSMFKLIKKRIFPNIGFDKCYMMPVYIDDLVDAFMECLNTDARNRIYIIAGPDFMDKRDFAACIAKALGVKPLRITVPTPVVSASAYLCESLFGIIKKQPPLSRKKLRFFLISRKYSIERAKKELEYNPKVAIREGLLRTFEWYKEKGFI